MCANPLILSNKMAKYGGNKYTTPVPCGRCPICVKNKINAWSFRLEQQLKVSKNPLFVTLTYNEQKVPYTQYGEQNLLKRDVQLFLKRLRYDLSKKYPKPPKLVYYACGEYGSRTHRPHYHILLFNLPFDDIYLIQKTWDNGFTKTLPLKTGGIPYVLKYMSKQKTPKNQMSKNPRVFTNV